MKTQVMSVTAYCYGIKNRCRKIDFHSFNIANDLPLDQVNRESLVLQAVVKVKAGMKTLAPNRNAWVTFTPMELEQCEGYQVRTCKLFVGDENKVNINHLLFGQGFTLKNTPNNGEPTLTNSIRLVCENALIKA